MSRPLSYTPPTPVDTSVADELADLTAALHESGLLRASAGGVRAYPQLLKQLLDTVNPRTLQALLALAPALRDLDPVATDRLAKGLLEARHEAARAAQGRPEGPLRLLRRMADPNTRRGISAALAAMAAVGGSLPE